MFLFIIKDHLTFAPIWDGGYYFNCVIGVVSAPFILENYNCSGHPSFLYTFLLSLGQYLDKGSIVYLHLTNISLFIISTIFFYSLLTLFSVDKARRVEKILMGCCFAVYPFFTANIVNVSPDIGVLVFSILVLWAFLYKKVLWAAILGWFLVFSKESGLVIYVYLVIFYWLFIVFSWQPIKINRNKIKIGQIALLLAPLIAFIILAVSMRTYLSNHIGFSDLFDNLLGGFSLANKQYQANFILVLVLGFNWIMSVIILAGIVVSLARFFKQSRKISWKDSYTAERKRSLYILAVFLATMFTLTLYKIYINVRYYMLLYPLLFLLFYNLLPVVVRNRYVRVGILGVYCFLLLLSNYLMLDPVSRMIFGTFKFGNRDILKMTSYTGEPDGYGKDQLIYNLQYTNFQYATNEIFLSLKPTNNNVFVVHEQVNWNFIDALDSRTYKRTYRERSKKIIPVIVETEQFLKGLNRPQKIYFIEYPNFENSADLVRLSKEYDVVEVRRLGREEYFIPVYEMTLRTV